MSSVDREPSSDSDLARRRNFSVRLTQPLYEQLEQLGKGRGESMNKLVGSAVATLVGQPELAPTAGAADVNAQIARDAVRQGPEAIGPLKGIAKHANNRDQVALACVLWAAAARLVAATDGLEEASQELAHSAAVAEASNHLELAVALYEEALRLDPHNLDATNRLGQRLHHLAQKHHDDVDRYREAERLLARVTFVDNHAKLFHGWSALHLARADGDRDLEDHALAEITEALKSWAFGQRADQERTSWLRHVRRLLSADLDERAEALVEFANRNARWTPISDKDVHPPGAETHP